MRLNEILTESQVQEGPLLNKLGSTVGKAAGTVAKGVGAVAGGIAGIGKAFKKGYQAGKTTVGSGGDSDGAEPTAAGAGGAASGTGSASSGTGTSAPATTSKPAAQSKPAATTATPAAQSKPDQTTSQPAAAPAQSSEQPAAKAANDTQYAQAQKAIAALQPADQKTILTALQADPKVKSAMAKAAQPQQKQPAAAPAAEPEVAPAAPGTTAPAATTTEPNKPVKKGSRKKAAAPSQAEIDADRARIMGPTSDSVIRTGKSIVENISEAGLMAKLGSKVGQAAQAVGNVAGKNVGAVQQAKADPEHAKNLVKAFATGDTSKDPNSAPPIEDKSGTVPKQIIDKINQLNIEQRAELHKLITQKTL